MKNVKNSKCLDEDFQNYSLINSQNKFYLTLKSLQK